MVVQLYDDCEVGPRLRPEILFPLKLQITPTPISWMIVIMMMGMMMPVMMVFRKERKQTELSDTAETKADTNTRL